MAVCIGLGRTKTRFLIGAAWGALAFAGCGKSEQVGEALSDPVTPTTSTTVVQATTDECLYGGWVIVSATDAAVTRNKVCNGAPGVVGATGAQGIGAGIELGAASLSACPAGGTLITTFIDANDDGILDPGETVTSLSTVCNGLAGATGAIGATGTAGENARLTVQAATSAQCPAGGAVYESFIGDAAPVDTVVCNGANGTNAVFETGPVGPVVAGQPYSACHHDYLYLPGSGEASGWLVFRHQENGQADQGIGSTGFQVWNVDISDFLLVSEVGNVTYCTLHWDPAAKQLSYVVDDDSDGLAGQSGLIQL